MAYFKVIKSGHIIEIYEYEKSLDEYEISLDLPDKKDKNDAEKKVEEQNDTTDKEHNKKTNNIRARQNARRLVNSNWVGESGEYFITLTYADNMQDVEQANKHYQNYIKALKRRYDPDIKYIATMEWQKRGSIHYHMIVKGNLDFGNDIGQVERDMHDTIWKHGWVTILELWTVDNIGAYITKEMLKDTQKQQREKGKRRYYHSRNLDKPEQITGDDAKIYIDTMQANVPHFTNSYESVYTGKVMYREYNMKRIKRGDF